MVKNVIGYYGSELNRFIDEYCSHEMDSINIDCLQLKVAKKRIRFIEYKRSREKMPRSEIRVYNILKYLFSKVESEWNIELYIVRGDYPFETALVKDFTTGQEWKLNQDELIKWLNFDLNLLSLEVVEE